jgi:hypothetical protein
MASIAGGHHVVGTGSDHGAAGPPGPLGAFSLYLIGHPQPLGSGPDTLLGGSHITIAGAQSGGSDSAGGGRSTGPGIGHDTVTGPEQGLPMAGEPRPGADHVVATETHHGGDTTVHLTDGTSLTVLGATHIDSTLFH